MSSGGHVDKIAAEFGVYFIDPTRAPKRHQSKARRSCQEILSKHGPRHLRLVFGLINSNLNRGSWTAPIFKAVSWLVANRGDLTAHPDFVSVMDNIDLAQMFASAKRINQKAPTVTLSVLLSHEVDRQIQQIEAEKAA